MCEIYKTLKAGDELRGKHPIDDSVLQLRMVACMPNSEHLFLLQSTNTLSQWSERDIRKIGAVHVRSSRREKSGTRTRSRRHCVVYLLDLGFGHVKVGRTMDLQQRLRGLRVASLCKIAVVKTWSVAREDASCVETQIKRAMRHRFAMGGGTEVFRVSAKHAIRIIEVILRRKS